MVMIKEADSALHALDRYVTAHDYRGQDPYDALSSPLGSKLRGRQPRQALIQAVRRAPMDLRPLLRVPPVRMAKAIALFSSGLRRATSLPDARSRATTLAAELGARRVDGAWGYEFDVQTRWGFYPAGSPNIIATAFVIEALAEADLTSSGDPAADWLQFHMIHPDGYMRYVPGNDRLIHNANVLGARALFRLAPDHPAVSSSIAHTVRAQRADGLWPYGAGPGLEWIDNFHTAYVLLALKDIDRPIPGREEALQRGTQAWLRRCFNADGGPYYYADRAGPIDVHNVATALHALADLSSVDRACKSVLPGTLRYALTLQRKDGAFVSRPNALPFMRWNQAHMFRALAELSVFGPSLP